MIRSRHARAYTGDDSTLQKINIVTDKFVDECEAVRIHLRERIYIKEEAESLILGNGGAASFCYWLIN